MTDYEIVSDLSQFLVCMISLELVDRVLLNLQGYIIGTSFRAV